MHSQKNSNLPKLDFGDGTISTLNDICWMKENRIEPIKIRCVSKIAN